MGLPGLDQPLLWGFWDWFKIMSALNANAKPGPGIWLIYEFYLRKEI